MTHFTNVVMRRAMVRESTRPCMPSKRPMVTNCGTCSKISASTQTNWVMNSKKTISCVTCSKTLPNPSLIYARPVWAGESRLELKA